MGVANLTSRSSGHRYAAPLNSSDGFLRRVGHHLSRPLSQPSTTTISGGGLLIEGGAHFEPVLLPRLKRLGAAWVWKNGKPAVLNDPGLFLRVHTLEQYEDTLANLDTELESGQSADFDDPTLSLRYRLHRTPPRGCKASGSSIPPTGY